MTLSPPSAGAVVGVPAPCRSRRSHAPHISGASGVNSVGLWHLTWKATEPPQYGTIGPNGSLPQDPLTTIVTWTRTAQAPLYPVYETSTDKLRMLALFRLSSDRPVISPPPYQPQRRK